MKKLSQGVALIIVTTLFATAFTTSHRDIAAAKKSVLPVQNPVARVVITGKRMTALEKAHYDADMLVQTAAPATTGQSDSYRLAVK